MAFCLPPQMSSKFLDALRGGKIDPDQLTAMTSAERRDFLGSIVGEENAADVNALLESKLLLKNQQAGLVAWAQQVAGLKPAAKRGLIDRIERLDKVLNPAEERDFLADLAAQKLGFGVTREEAAGLTAGAKVVQGLKARIAEDMPDEAPERFEYALAKVLYDKQLSHMMGRDKFPTLADFKDPIKALEIIGGTTKGIQASMDLSFALRQGLKTLLTNPDVWVQGVVKGVDAAKKELLHTKGEIEPMDLVKAGIFGRKNALNGAYAAGKYHLGMEAEEAFPQALPELIPGVGRLYKASESGYNAMALQMRADMADRMIERAKDAGLDVLNPAQAEPIGELVNSLTGRGTIKGLTPQGHRLVNALMFSVRYLKSNYDMLTLHNFGMGIKDAAARAFIRKEAAKNLVKVIGGMSVVLGAASLLWPGSVETDPRSSQFGKIKLGQTTFDISGGAGPLVTLAARLATMSTKSSQSGQVSELGSGKFGAQTGLDMLNAFFENRASPIVQAALNYFRGQNFQGQKPTLLNTVGTLVTPMPFQTLMQAQAEPNAAVGLAAVIADALGVSANPPNALGLPGLPVRDPTSLELIRLGFGPSQVHAHTGDSHMDGLINEHVEEHLMKYLPPFIASQGYFSHGDAWKKVALSGYLKAAMKAAEADVYREDPITYRAFKMKQRAAENPNKAALANEMRGGVGQ